MNQPTATSTRAPNTTKATETRNKSAAFFQTTDTSKLNQLIGAIHKQSMAGSPTKDNASSQSSNRKPSRQMSKPFFIVDRKTVTSPFDTKRDISFKKKDKQGAVMAKMGDIYSNLQQIKSHKSKEQK